MMEAKHISENVDFETAVSRPKVRDHPRTVMSSDLFYLHLSSLTGALSCAQDTVLSKLNTLAIGIQLSL